jgi:nitroreductase
MSFLEIAKARFSVRKYTDQPVEREKLEMVLEAGRIAPSACNYQPWEFIVITDEEKRKAMGEAYPQPWFINAPVIIGVMANYETAWTRRDGKNYADVDVAIAMDHMILQATELGLGTCWIGAFYPEAAREILSIPQHLEPMLFTPLGYPAEQPREKRRKGLDEVVHWETF